MSAPVERAYRAWVAATERVARAELELDGLGESPEAAEYRAAVQAESVARQAYVDARGARDEPADSRRFGWVTPVLFGAVCALVVLAIGVASMSR